MGFQVEGQSIRSDILEIDVVDHCNLSCRSCAHLAPVRKKKEMDPVRIRKDLGLLGRCYHARNLRVMGGEPLLHSRLAELLESVSESGISDELTLVTNGILLEKAPAELWRWLDRVEISVYPGHRLSEAALSRIRGVLESNEVELKILKTESFRESYASRENKDPELVRRIYSTCLPAHVWGCHQVYDGYFYKCAQAHAIALHATPTDVRDPREDGVRLEVAKIEDLFAELKAYLQSPEPLRACRNCLGSVGKKFSHETPSRGNWRAAQNKAVKPLIDAKYLEVLETLRKTGNLDMVLMTLPEKSR